VPERPPDPALEESTNKWMRWGLILMVIMVLAFPVYRLTEPDRRAGAAEERLTELAAQGEGLFALTCSGCHGPEGKGGSTAPTLDAKEFLQFVVDDQIASLIATGVPGTQMSPYSLDFGGPFTQEQIVALTTYLRSLEANAPSVPDWATGGRAGEAVSPTSLPEESEVHEATDEATETLLEEGAEMYAANCAACHGADLGGQVGPALGAGSSAAAIPDEDLIAVITDGRGAMPGFGSSLTPEQIEAAVIFIRSTHE
jgi:mono/diheme cytochrome c family protein